MDDKFYSFEKAREYVRTLNLKGLGEWLQYTKTTDFPDFLPKRPETFTAYKGKWQGVTDWVGGTHKKYATRGDLLPFEEAREYVRNLELKGQKQWLAWLKTKPDFIPSNPNNTYKKDWVDTADWLGTTRRRSTSFLSFEESREYARGLNISSIAEWEALCREGKMPQNIPNSPDLTFSSKWITWYDWLGTVQEE